MPLPVLEEKHQVALADGRRHIRGVLLDAVFLLRFLARPDGDQVMPAAA
jgi:hypothetical protein